MITCQQARRGDSAIDNRDRLRNHRLAAAAGVLRIDLSPYEEPQRLAVDLLADLIADMSQLRTALPAGVRGWFMPGLDPRQFRRQRATLGRTRCSLGRRRAQRLKLGFDHFQVRCQRFFEQRALFGIHPLRTRRKLHALH